jgi:uncharacterized membrane protein
MNDVQLSDQTCPVCGRAHPEDNFVDGQTLPPKLVDKINRRQPGWTPGQAICMDCLHDVREDYGQAMLEDSLGELTEPERAVVNGFGEDAFLSENTMLEYDRDRTRPQRLADGLVSVIGSLWFSSTILLLLALWLVLNVGLRLFEPYPTITLAVISAALASLAAIQGPIILMSQRSQSQRDRLRAVNDYEVNLKAELQIRYMGDKIDHMLQQQGRIHRELHEELAVMAQVLEQLKEIGSEENQSSE